MGYEAKLKELLETDEVPEKIIGEKNA